MPAEPFPLSHLSLRARERGILLGGTEAGKSTLADYLGRDFVNRYAHVHGRRLITDTKPRYRAQWELSGLSARRRFRRWDHGQAIADSVIVDDPDDLERGFSMCSTVIMQCETARDIGRVVAGVAAFLRSSRAKRPQLLQVDEVRDFYYPNGSAKGGDDAVERCVRAGRERGTGVLICGQRTKGIPATLMEELSKCYLFRMDYVADAKRLQEMGAPPTMRPPRAEHTFLYWTKRDYRTVYGPYRLALPAAA